MHFEALSRTNQFRKVRLQISPGIEYGISSSSVTLRTGPRRSKDSRVGVKISRRVKPMWIVDILDWMSRDCESELRNGDCEELELFIRGTYNAMINSILIRDYNSFHANSLDILRLLFMNIRKAYYIGWLVRNIRMFKIDALNRY